MVMAIADPTIKIAVVDLLQLSPDKQIDLTIDFFR